MKIKSIEAGARLAAWITAAAAVPFGLLFLRSGGPVWTLLLAWLAVWLAAYLSTRYAVKKFVIYKLKPLYQLVLSRDIKTRELEHEMMHRSDMMENIGTELSAWAETNRREIARLKENEKYRKEFLGNVSHEIKTPVFNIQGYITTLLDGGMDDPAVNRRYLERSEKSIDRLINIVNDLEEISKLESGALHLQSERFDIVSLAREITETLAYEAESKNIRIHIGNSPAGAQPAVMVRADKRYIGQVLVNLIVNSIRYGNSGGSTRIGFIDLFDKVMIEVADNGVGISKEDIPRIFERFYRTDKSRSREQGGTGLGLSIVKHIVEAHGESISVRSVPGRGSTFSFTLRKD